MGPREKLSSDTGLMNDFADPAGTLGLERPFRVVSSWVGMVRPLHPLTDPSFVGRELLG